MSAYGAGAKRNLELSSPQLKESGLAADEEAGIAKVTIDMHAQTQKVGVDVIPEEADAASNDDLRVALVK